MVCGIAIPHEHSLAGHSDADVGLHALTDALLGAIGAGDIGMHFPPSDPRWRGAASTSSSPCRRPRPRASGGSIAAVDVTDHLRTPEDRPAPRQDDRARRRILGIRSRPGQRQGDDDRAARLYRARRRHRGAGDRDRAAAAYRSRKSRSEKPALATSRRRSLFAFPRPLCCCVTRRCCWRAGSARACCPMRRVPGERWPPCPAAGSLPGSAAGGADRRRHPRILGRVLGIRPGGAGARRRRTPDGSSSTR